MDNTDWISVTKRRRTIKKELSNNDNKECSLDKQELPISKLKIKPESLQNIIRKRIQMKVNQDRADILCGFPRNTFKNIESNRLIPNNSQKLRIENILNVIVEIVSLN